jgi:hypothetical protein
MDAVLAAISLSQKLNDDVDDDEDDDDETADDDGNEKFKAIDEVAGDTPSVGVGEGNVNVNVVGIVGEVVVVGDDDEATIGVVN